MNIKNTSNLEKTTSNESEILISMVKAGLNGKELKVSINKELSSFMLFKDMVNNYEK